VKILPYKMGSQSAKKLAHQLNIKRLKSRGPVVRDVVLNWGASSPSRKCVNYINKPEAVALASNKLRAFRTMLEANVNVVPFTTHKFDVERWLDEGTKVVARKLLSSHSGRGIVVIKTKEDFVPAPLYTKYIKKDDEFRVHVFKEKVIDYVCKRKRTGVEADPYIRSHNNGWVFCRDAITLSEGVKNEAVAAVKALGLDFGAVDVVFRNGRAFVLEVNTAPGLEGTTLQRYADAFRRLAR
jgi:glutathione synthase/RimK-type ligase-like ATP-grasp enzyme